MIARYEVRTIGVGVALLGVATIALAACSAPPPQAATPPAPPTPSFDGRYVGSLRITGAAQGMNRSDCATEPTTAIVVSGNRFTLPVPHPGVAAATPSLAPRTTPVYEARIAADGTITGTSDNNATLTGRVAGPRMSGEIYGLLCSYAFTADRA